ncbi:MAG: hypothetical protein A2Y79_08675 [Deltaproteobacteria bacterium RBG_13_43_22]|jgi:hypothetical protein|nr:MAG: hypothetical protein A2Y79_08675 [Deltaproteobacteria bacterium RBG_13_43_22]
MKPRYFFNGTSIRNKKYSVKEKKGLLGEQISQGKSGHGKPGPLNHPGFFFGDGCGDRNKPEIRNASSVEERGQVSS